MTQSVSRAALAIAVAAIGLGACTDTTPWAYSTDSSATAQLPRTVGPEVLPVTRPVAQTVAPRRPIPRQIYGAAPPVSAYVAPQMVAVAPVAVVPAPQPMPSAVPVQPLPAAPRVVTAPMVVTPGATTTTVYAPTVVYAPAAPTLFEKSGLIDIVLSDKAGQPDGVILKDETVVQFSPAFGAAMDPDGSRLAPGRPIIVRGTWTRDRHKRDVLNVVEMGTDVYSMVTLGSAY
jgi:hypothetical protein